jgi:WD40 repeat protein
VRQTSDTLDNGGTPEPGAASRVFISYSRKDMAFARRLEEALEAAGRETWIDLEGIPLSAEWLREIQSAIEAADACVFILSPSFVASEVCRAELQHAVDNNKRLIPVVWCDPGPGVATALAQLNWLFAREGDDFAAAIAALEETLDTDFGHVRMHTRLLVRAHEWEAEEREKSYLLQGRDLQEALAWLAEGIGKEPAATPLHREYLEASRQNAIARRRRLIASVTVASTIILVLAFAGFRQLRGRQRQGRVTAAQKLAEASRKAQNEGQPQRSLWLAAAAMQATAGAGEPVERQARERMLNALARVGGTPLRDPGGPIAVTAVSDDGRWLVTGGPGGVRLWDLTRAEGAGSGALLPDSPKAVRALAISARGERVAAGGEDGTLHAWTRQGHHETRTGHRDAVLALVFGPGGDSLLSGGEDGTARLWNLTGTAGATDGAIVHRPGRGESAVVAVGISADGHWLAAAPRGGKLHVVNRAVGTDLRLLHTWGRPLQLDFSPSGRFLATAAERAWALLWDLPAASQELRAGRDPGGAMLGMSLDYVCAVAFSPRGDVLALGRLDGRIDLWHPSQTKEPFATLGEQSSFPVCALGFASDGGLLATGGNDRKVRIWKRDPGNRRSWSESQVLTGHDDIVRSVSFTRGGTHAVSASQDGTVRLWDLRSPWRFPSRNLPPGIFSGTVSSDGRLLAPAGLQAGGRIRVLDLTREAEVDDLRPYGAGHDARGGAVFAPGGRWLVTGTADEAVLWLWDLQSDPASRRPAILHGRGGPIASAQFSPDGRWLAASGEDWTRLWDLRGGPKDSPRFDLSVPALEPETMASPFSPDGRWFVGVREDQSTYLWDLDASADQTPIVVATWQELEEYRPSMLSGAFSRDSRWLAVSSALGFLLWDLRPGAGKAPVQVIEPGENVGTLAFSPTDDRLITAGEDGVVWLREPPRKMARVKLGQHPDAVTASAWSSDGRWLATGSSDGTILLWSAAPGARPALRSPLRGHTASILSLAFDSRSQRLVSASDDNTVRVWSLDADSRIGEHLTLSRDSLTTRAAFTPDGRGVLMSSGEYPDPVQLWPLTVEPLLAVACEQVGIQRRPEDWARLAGDVPYQDVCGDRQQD